MNKLLEHEVNMMKLTATVTRDMAAKAKPSVGFFQLFPMFDRNLRERSLAKSAQKSDLVGLIEYSRFCIRVFPQSL